MDKLIRFIIFILSFTAFTCSAVTCEVLLAQINTVGFGTVNVQRDTPPGATIASTVSPGYAKAKITSDTGESCPGNYSMVYLSGVESSISGVYKTNLDGVGIKVNGMPGDFSLPPVTPSYVFNLGYYTVSLVKTGNITPGLLTPGLIAQAWFGTPGSYFTKISLDANSQVNVLSCSISSQVLNFDLGSVSAAEFGSAAGFTPSHTDTQNLGLNCNPGANINVELKGVQNPDASANASVLALTGQGGDNVADGVGVQLLYNNAPIQLNNRLMLKQSPGGLESFPIMARYYQTKSLVKAGEANATATLDMTYQ
ncbi:Fimbria adhesin protein [Klebsiella huaxiensis]|uniref:Fimbrial protein n=1 Tax=Klebsiella huaxiensis TaxID=2153354 RepID=A0ABT6EBZ5_9ENTR|nr:fimbrial protein [Klebsiella huaxiensis]MDG1642940.1 fimbrial protein [Klebsiella huaxiensis]VUS66608.1 Fimbria adhesin protein [Klebsiella huaxiensis]VUT17438.1 Fimbria adhesin protein [Klebsiella huaxiensis]